jgi:hypothetical protein
MATIVNNPAPVEDRSNTASILTALLVLAVIVLLLVYGIPALRGAAGGANTNTSSGVQRGVGGGGDTNVTVPKDIYVNVNPGNNSGK